MSDVDTSVKRRNKRWPEALKREIVAATFEPGASVSVVARQYDVNANQVFSWRRRFCDAGEPPPAAPTRSTLVPVMITSGPEVDAAAPAVPDASDTIEIEVLGDCRIRVGSGFDGRTLKRLLDVLSRAEGVGKKSR